MGANTCLDTNPADLNTVQQWFRTATDDSYLELLQPALQALWPEVEFASFRTRPCNVTYTPDRFPLIAETQLGLVVATAGHGGGAKGSDVSGAMAADLILGR
ncbi:MAG: glycine/D-amino acid oxidase-like deaminating enzyme [Candidatus Poriferisodalaceae bacterium]|jgi:glycine/D-amino acid oxidase-like deaminating enzyme